MNVMQSVWLEGKGILSKKHILILQSAGKFRKLSTMDDDEQQPQEGMGAVHHKH